MTNISGKSRRSDPDVLVKWIIGCWGLIPKTVIEKKIGGELQVGIRLS